MRHFDFSPLYRSTIGFDRLANLISQFDAMDAPQPSYPPYNIEKLAEDGYRISIAVAGFAEADLVIEARENALLVKGERKPQGEAGASEFLHQGIAARAFERRFQLADHVRVTGARLESGLLHIELVRELPEAARPRVIPIATTLEGHASTKTVPHLDA